MGNIWNIVILQPFLNSLVVLYNVLFHNFGLTIVVLTAIIRAAMFPLTLQQLRSTKKMQDLQPKMAKLQKKYPKDKQKLSEETMKLYRESGINPAGCAVSLLIQFPIWFALYQSIIKVLAATPEDFLGLSRLLYSWSIVNTVVPLGSRLLWIDLAKPDTLLIMPILVAGTMWVQQKMITVPTFDPQQDQRNQMMLWMMPLMFAAITLSTPSGLAFYWITSNIITIIIQYRVTGWGGLAKQKAVAVP